MADIQGINSLGGDEAVVSVPDTAGERHKATAVVVVDTAGAAVSLTAPTRYTEDVALPADPVGLAIIVRQAASAASQGAANGDGVALGGTAKGELFVKATDTDTALAALIALLPAALGVGGGLKVDGSGTALVVSSAGVGAIADAAYTDDTGAASGSVVALLKGCFVKLCEIADNTAAP